MSKIKRIEATIHFVKVRGATDKILYQWNAKLFDFANTYSTEESCTEAFETIENAKQDIIEKLNKDRDKELIINFNIDTQNFLIISDVNLPGDEDDDNKYIEYLRRRFVKSLGVKFYTSFVDEVNEVKSFIDDIISSLIFKKHPKWYTYGLEGIIKGLCIANKIDNLGMEIIEKYWYVKTGNDILFDRI